MKVFQQDPDYDLIKKRIENINGLWEDSDNVDTNNPEIEYPDNAVEDYLHDLKNEAFMLYKNLSEMGF